MFFEKPPSKIETVNDLDGDVVNFFRVIQNPESCQELQDWLTYTPYSRQVYDESFVREPQSPVEQAGYFAVRSMQSHGFRLTEKCGWKKDVHGREAVYAVRNWNRLPESLAEMAIRLKGVQIENKPALELIRAFDHEELLKTVISSRAKVMISGYDCELYEKYLKGWREKQIPARAQNSLPRLETLWMNF